MTNKRRNKRRETQRQQAAATTKLHPRWLARSVAKHLNGGKLPKSWRKAVAALPRTGQKYLYPWKHDRIDCSGYVSGKLKGGRA